MMNIKNTRANWQKKSEVFELSFACSDGRFRIIGLAKTKRIEVNNSSISALTHSFQSFDK